LSARTFLPFFFVASCWRLCCDIPDFSAQFITMFLGFFAGRLCNTAICLFFVHDVPSTKYQMPIRHNFRDLVHTGAILCRIVLGGWNTASSPCQFAYQFFSGMHGLRRNMRIGSLLLAGEKPSGDRPGMPRHCHLAKAPHLGTMATLLWKEPHNFAAVGTTLIIYFSGEAQ
jgi:hypothetical protein